MPQPRDFDMKQVICSPDSLVELIRSVKDAPSTKLGSGFLLFLFGDAGWVKVSYGEPTVKITTFTELMVAIKSGFIDSVFLDTTDKEVEVTFSEDADDVDLLEELGT